jgi:zona occludens toxin (predicted ATPase)
LIGISAGTGLGSAILSKNEAETDAAKKQAEAGAAGRVAPAVVAPAPTPTPPPTPTPTPTPLETKEIVVYPDKIKAAKAALAQAKEAKNIDQVTAQTIEVTKWKRALKHWRARNRGQLLKDLLSEEEGEGRVITFHRFQIVGWTLILGVVFVSEVLSKLSMPVFDATLLTLMGISSGTYLGFRASAK